MIGGNNKMIKEKYTQVIGHLKDHRREQKWNRRKYLKTKDTWQLI